MNAFKTSYGRVIPSAVMRRVCERMSNDDDWQAVATDELRQHIPEHAEDLDELNEVLREAEGRNEDTEIEEQFESDEELGVSDDNWACGTLDPET